MMSIFIITIAHDTKEAMVSYKAKPEDAYNTFRLKEIDVEIKSNQTGQLVAGATDMVPTLVDIIKHFSLKLTGKVTE